MDQEREKLARETARSVLSAAHESECHSDRPGLDAVEQAEEIIHRALEQWGDLRAEQVRRETVEEACRAACGHCADGEPWTGDLGAVEPGDPGWWLWHDNRDVPCEAGYLRRAFAASQGGT